METLTDVAINPDPYLQKGDLVAAALFFESLAISAIGAFLLFQVNHVPRKFRNAIVVGVIIMFCAALAAFFRRDFWVETSTNPVEFKFFDWFITVPLMALQFYMLARPAGAKFGFLVRTTLAVMAMLTAGYLGEAVFPEAVVEIGLLATICLVAVISSIMLDGYRKVAKNSPDPALKKGYLMLGTSLPIAWLAYPFCYLSVPGNLLEGFMSPETMLIVYSLSNVLSKGGLVLGVYFIAIYSLEAKGVLEDMPFRDTTGEPNVETKERIPASEILAKKGIPNPFSSPASVAGGKQTPWT